MWSNNAKDISQGLKKKEWDDTVLHLLITLVFLVAMVFSLLIDTALEMIGINISYFAVLIVTFIIFAMPAGRWYYKR